MIDILDCLVDACDPSRASRLADSVQSVFVCEQPTVKRPSNDAKLYSSRKSIPLWIELSSHAFQNLCWGFVVTIAYNQCPVNRTAVMSVFNPRQQNRKFFHQPLNAAAHQLVIRSLGCVPCSNYMPERY